MRRLALMLSFAALAACGSTQPTDRPTPLVIGDTFTLHSTVLDENRRINVFTPTVYGEVPDGPLPVLYMPDGGMAEDFLHVAGLMQVSLSNGTMRPFLLVGIENTERRRDLTGPTSNEEDKKIAPRVGGSEQFRQFIREELMPSIRERYATTDETAIVGESLAGLFVVETFLREPDLFDSYLAFDPSLWWNDHALVDDARDLLANSRDMDKSIFLASSDEPDMIRLTQQLADILKTDAGPNIASHYVPMPDEHHSTIYHPAALKAFRAVLGPPAS